MRNDDAIEDLGGADAHRTTRHGSAGQMTERTAELVGRSLAPETAAAFDDRLREQASWLRAAIEEGRMDNDDFAVGLEMELYAVTDGAGPRRSPGCRTGSSRARRTRNSGCTTSRSTPNRRF